MEAVNGEEALLLLDARPDAKVLFTDVKMPGLLDGYVLARIVSKRRPDIGILVASGNRLPGPGDLPPGARFLAKPYSPSALLDAIEGLAAVEVEAHPVRLEMPFTVDSTPAASLPLPVQEPEKR